MGDIYFVCDAKGTRMSENINAHFNYPNGLSIDICDVKKYNIGRGGYIYFSDGDIPDSQGVFKLDNAMGGGAFIVSKIP